MIDAASGTAGRRRRSRKADAPDLQAAFLDRERARLEEQLCRAQRMEAVGQLVGGVVHDFNNLLTVVSGYCDLLQGSMDEGDARRAMVEQISLAAGRAAALTSQLLAFSRQVTVQPQVLELSVVITRTLQLLRRTLGEDVIVTTDLQATRRWVQLDEGHGAQVLMNLAVNARDAMPEGGHFTIELADARLDDQAATARGVVPGEYVRLTVTDTGCGMPPEVQARAFEPFYTTKAPGRGTGLGLATVHDIVTQGGGHIEIASVQGHGTTFIIDLPAVPEPIDAGPCGSARGEGPVAAASGETVLLVEDERQVRDAMSAMLRRLGYHVLVPDTAVEALSMVSSGEHHVDLLMTDVVMPGLNGRQLAEQVRCFEPRAKVLFVTGHTRETVARHGASESQVSLLRKPFTIQVLARRLRELLQAR